MPIVSGSNGLGIINVRVSEPALIGTIMLGTYYTLPHSPDMSLQVSFNYSGSKSFETKGGSTLTNTNYTGPGNWIDLPAWNVAHVDTYAEMVGGGQDGSYDVNYADPMLIKNINRSGRRIFDLTFSFLNDEDVFPSNTMLSQQMVDTSNNIRFTTSDGATGGGYSTNDLRELSGNFYHNIITHDSFFSQVLQKTNGGVIPFIFQPDTDNYTDMALCVIDQNSITLNQASHRKFTCKLRLKEIW